MANTQAAGTGTPDPGAAAAAAAAAAGNTNPDGTAAAAAKKDDTAGGGGGTGAAAPKPGDDSRGKGSEGTGSKTPEGKAGGEEPPKAPDKYELTVPESGKAYVDPEMLKRIEGIARANNFSNEDAQAFLEEQVTVIGAQAQAWQDQTKADPDYGGEKLEETKKLAQRAIDRIRPAGHGRRDSFLSFLTRGGAGNHIEVVSFLADLGKMMGEDTPPHGRSARQGTGDGASKLYDHPDSKKLEEETRGR